MALNFRKVRIGFMNLILDFLEGQDKAVKMSKDIIAFMKKDMGLDVVEFDEPVAGGVQATIRVTVEIEGESRPGCVIDTISRYYAEEPT